MLSRLILLLSVVNVNLCLAQNCLDDILRNDLYSNSWNIVNGRKWVYEKKYPGSPLLSTDYWPKADISYNGTQFFGQFMNYDLYKNEIIIYHPEKQKEKFVSINIEYLSGFTFTDTITGKRRIFEYTELPGIDGRSLYEYISDGANTFYIKPTRKIEIRSADKSRGQWINYYEYYLNKDSLFVRVRSKHQIIALFPEHSSDLNRFFRKNRLRINDQNPEGIISAIAYLNSLK